MVGCRRRSCGEVSNPKLQIPSSNHSQLPNPKAKRKSKSRSGAVTGLGFGAWDLAWIRVGSGWSLGFGLGIAEHMLISLFITCYNDTLFPETGKAVVTVLERLGHQVEFREAQTCCGQMHYNTGYAADALPLMRRMIEVFRGSGPICVPSASCVAMMRDHYPKMAAESADPALQAAVADLLPRVFEFSELLVDKLRRHRRRRDLPAHRHAAYVLSLAAIAPPDRPAAAAAAGGARTRARALPRQDECCGFGGTFAVKNAEVSTAMGLDKVRAIEESGADRVHGRGQFLPDADRRAAAPPGCGCPVPAPRGDSGDGGR